MRTSRTLIPTLKEDPTEAQVISHRLMLRAGLIRQLAAGIYTWLPVGLKVLRQVERIVREEMDRAGAQEVLMPAVQPAELWQESGRWFKYGPELLRMKDRQDREFCFGPTHEEVISDLVRREIHSYRDLPANFYQIQTKFRDEVRPRFGIMRGREFLMKDAYSFHIDAADAEKTYAIMVETYRRIFRRCGLNFRAVEADTGSIGGAFSHEFHVLAESGEDTIVSCSGCDYAANLEKANAASLPSPAPDTSLMTRVATPEQRTIDEVSAFLKTPPQRIIKCLPIRGESGWCLLLLRGDHELNEIKARAVVGGAGTLPRADEVQGALGLPVGFLGPVGLKKCGQTVRVLADHALRGLSGLVCGANEAGWHLAGITPGRDFPEPEWVDLRNVVAGDPCPRCAGGKLTLDRGIEVGHVFKLGNKYSKALNVSVLNEHGSETILEMGCYGIGVSRIVAAAIEQNHDANGIIWPMALAPFQVLILLLNPKDEEGRGIAEKLYDDLTRQGLAPLLDDRDERMGVKFKDADLLGIPLRVVVGGRSLKEGVVEIQQRRGGEARKVPPTEAASLLTKEARAAMGGE